MTIFFYVLMYLPAAFAGLGYISNFWIIVSLVSAWFWSIWLTSDRGGTEYHKLEQDEFLKKNKQINVRVAIRFFAIAAVFGIAFLFR